MFRFVLCLLASVAVIDGARLDQKKMASVAKSQDAQVVKEEILEQGASADRWWEALAQECKTCLLKELYPVYKTCKETCFSKPDFRDYTDCKTRCRSTHGRSSPSYKPCKEGCAAKSTQYTTCKLDCQEATKTGVESHTASRRVCGSQCRRPVPQPVRPVPWPAPVPSPQTQDSCPWKSGVTDGNDKILCSDGSVVTNWLCAKAGHGQRLQCPPNFPKMCAEKNCGGGLDHCCATSCGEKHGGERPCPGDEQQPSTPAVPAAPRPVPIAPVTTTEAPSVDFSRLELGNPNDPLVPGLVPKPGQTFKVANVKARNGWEWKLVSIEDGGRTERVNTVFARVPGKYETNKNYQIDVQTVKGDHLFKIACAKRVWPIGCSDRTFHILKPYSDKILYTIRKDIIGTGWMLSKKEWEIFRGEDRDDDKKVYYCVESSEGPACYHSKDQHDHGVKESATKYKGRSLEVDSGEDTALLFALTVIIDIANK